MIALPASASFDDMSALAVVRRVRMPKLFIVGGVGLVDHGFVRSRIYGALRDAFA